MSSQEVVVISRHGVNLAQVGQQPDELVAVVRQDRQGPGQAGNVDPVPDQLDAADLLGVRMDEAVLQRSVRP